MHVKKVYMFTDLDQDEKIREPVEI